MLLRETTTCIVNAERRRVERKSRQSGDDREVDRERDEQPTAFGIDGMAIARF